VPLHLAAHVELAPLLESDGPDFVASAAASRKLHSRWVAPPVTMAAFLAKMEQMQAPSHYAFAIRRVDTGALAGYAELTNVVRGAFLSAYLGYYAFAGHERQGLMTQGIRLVARHAFAELGLHRLEANIQPRNLASMALVRACGFAKEGYSPAYLKVRGRWRDHERWALLAS
jgi:ribosomal-protein-alanine N-acetyltransferase